MAGMHSLNAVFLILDAALNRLVKNASSENNPRLLGLKVNEDAKPMIKAQLP
ncbi:hypothetical protein Sjap_007190 [Stephania japonica]|uniref:Uncharacterized protein n=1 Tax=Stephania japonica TaxID=461633 RepID=A0AAP0JM47_9MAGN